jgi:hypothetical protein
MNSLLCAVQAKAEGRIGRASADPVLPYKAFFDLGGTSARADAVSIWIVQFVGREIRILDYIEGVGQEIGYYSPSCAGANTTRHCSFCRMMAMRITARFTRTTETTFRMRALKSM